MLCGVVWCGVVLCGVAWRGVVWCGVVWYKTLRVNVALPSFPLSSTLSWSIACTVLIIIINDCSTPSFT